MQRRISLNLLFAAPAVAIILIFVIYPLGANLYFSFFSFRSGSAPLRPVGWTNYAHLVSDPIIVKALWNNTLYALVSIVFQVGLGLVVAAWITQLLGARLGAVIRSIYFLPAVISITVIALLFTFIYDARNGLLNSLLELIGLRSLKTAWLANLDTAMGSVIAVSQWQSVGYIMMLYIVSLQQIPPELYEAAAIDGAGRVRTFFAVTVPQAKEMIFVAMILTVSGAYTVFNEPYILTRGGPGNETQTLATYMYNQGFFQNQMGYAATIATLIFAITLILSVVQLAAFRTGKE